MVAGVVLLSVVAVDTDAATTAPSQRLPWRGSLRQYRQRQDRLLIHGACRACRTCRARCTGSPSSGSACPGPGSACTGTCASTGTCTSPSARTCSSTRTGARSRAGPSSSSSPFTTRGLGKNTGRNSEGNQEQQGKDNC
jgi:hypothetical protein